MKVTLLAALTADGFIAKNQLHAAMWSSKEDKARFSQVTKRIGVMVMGSTTFETIGRKLPGRRMIVWTTHPEKYDFEEIEFHTESPADLIARLEDEGVPELAVIGGANVYTQFMKAGLVDELFLTFEPLTFGTGITIFNAPLEANLSLIETEKLNESTVLLHYRVVK